MIATSTAASAECAPADRTNQYPEPKSMLAAWNENNPAEAYRAGKAALDRCSDNGQSEKCLDLMLAVAEAADAAGLHSEAEDISRGVLRVSRIAFGEDSLEVALAATNVGTNLANQSRFEQARGYYHIALDIRRRICGERDLATARSYRNLASVVGTLGYMTDAFRYSDASLKIELAVAGEFALSTADAYRSLALILGDEGESAKALDLTKKALAIQLRARPQDVFEIARCYNDIAVYLGQLKNTKEALENAEKSYEILRPILADDHPEMMHKMANLAGIYTAVGRLSEADAMIDKVIAAHKIHPGVAVEEVTTALSIRAGGLNREGRSDEALPLWRQVVELMAKTHGDESPRLLYYREILANAELGAGNPKLALAHFRILGAEADSDLLWAARRGISDNEAIDYRAVFAGQVSAAWAASHSP